jgi:hypothetical protein
MRGARRQHNGEGNGSGMCTIAAARTPIGGRPGVKMPGAAPTELRQLARSMTKPAPPESQVPVRHPLRLR